MDMLSSHATYDSLFIGNKLEEYLGDFNISEIQLFCYFSALLSLYDGKRVADWGYTFIKSELGVPLSREIEDAVNSLLCNKEIEPIDKYFKVTEAGRDKIKMLSELPRFKSRQKYLENSCDSLLTLPIGLVRNSITNDPAIKTASIASVRTLIDENSGATELLYEQFEILRKSLKIKSEDLFVPAVKWLELQVKQRTKENA
jgi:hypothetical protein